MFTARHISESLCHAYQANRDAEQAAPAADEELTFTGVALPDTLLQELTQLAEAEADRQGVTAAGEREDFVTRYVGRRLDESYCQGT